MSDSFLVIFTPAVTAFVIGILITPLVTHFLYKHKVWKKKAGKGSGYGGGATPVFDELHKEKDTNTPRMGGIVIWGSVLITTTIFVLLSAVSERFNPFNFLSREQTWLPLFALFVGAVVGYIDDLLVVRGTGKHFAGGLPLSQRLLVVVATSSFIAWWFYEKLDVSTVSFFGSDPIQLGWFFVPFFILTATSVYASSVIDGIDGLSGGVLASVFTAYAGVAIAQSQYDIAALCATIAGAILAFLWFNIPPARFYMTETGIMALTMSLTVVAFMTDTLGGGIGVSVLPIIAFLLVVTVLANILQILSKKLFGKKLFRIAPLHHHFEAIGWPSYKVTMRYWIISIVCALIGVALATIA